MKKIAIIGHFGGNKEFLDGQTIKTLILYEQLTQSELFDIYRVDTYYKSHNPLKLLFQTLVAIIKYRTIIILLSGNGMRLYFPLLFYISKIIHINVFHDVIGGNLSAYVKRYPHYIKYLNSFKANWVESESMKAELQSIGINNVEYIPNFKNLQSVPAADYPSDLYKFCTFSRVSKAKGIEDAIKVVMQINAEAGKNICTLDIYGQIDDEYKEDFKHVMANVSDAITYRGKIAFDKSVDVLKDYYMLLFPSFWQGEGFPGTFIDSFAASLPIIATDHNLNAEIIKHMVTGIIYPSKQFNSLYDVVQWSIEHPQEINNMRRCAEDEYKLYHPDFVTEKIVKRLNQC